METKALTIAISYTCLTSTTVAALAGEAHKAHVHGTANLTLVSENGVLEVQFDSPVMSLLGFEHKPRTKRQMKTMENTRKILSTSEKVFTINGANCTANRVNVEIHGSAGQALKSSEKHNDHDTNHSELLATYRFDCVNGKKIRSISVALFDVFPNLDRIKASWVTEKQQGQTTLGPSASTIEFR